MTGYLPVLECYDGGGVGRGDAEICSLREGSGEYTHRSGVLGEGITECQGSIIGK